MEGAQRNVRAGSRSVAGGRLAEGQSHSCNDDYAKPDFGAGSLFTGDAARPGSPRRLQFDASAKLSVLGGSFGAWGKILPRSLQAGGAADRPRSLLYRGKRSHADTVSQGLWPPDAHFADPFRRFGTATNNEGHCSRGF